jgi:hypothetical protein
VSYTKIKLKLLIYFIWLTSSLFTWAYRYDN